MLKTLKTFFQADTPKQAAVADINPIHLAGAALLVHAARLDGDFSTPEQAALAKIMEADFELDAQTRQELLDLAKSEETAAADLYRWTNVMNENMQPDEKISIIEQLWQIILADHEIDDYEANLMRRVSGLIHVPDRETGLARQRVEAAMQGN